MKLSKRSGFTLIELLVVIAIIALLLAILLPALQAAKKQSGAVICQSKLRQWGLGFAAYTSEHNGLLPYWAYGRKDAGLPDFPTGVPKMNNWFASIQAYWPDCNELLLCPLATRYIQTPEAGPSSLGATYLAWYEPSHGHGEAISSYGLNGSIAFVELRGEPRYDSGWRSCLVKGTDRVPVIMDCRANVVGVISPKGNPPPGEDVPGPFVPHYEKCMWPLVINRHSGGINGLFMDWSARKVGLKELWTLKWQKDYGTAGPWTKAGGVRPDAWPPWMQKFKDY